MKILILLTITLVHGYPRFQNQIPNGSGVPNPCSPGAYWNAVGHYHFNQGTLQKNQFALDFRTTGFQWTDALCRHDSDGDGRTNGEELGDPQCRWGPGQAVLQQATGHPGICEPVNSPTCLRKGFRCECMRNLNSCNMPGAPR